MSLLRAKSTTDKGGCCQHISIEMCNAFSESAVLKLQPNRRVNRHTRPKGPTETLGTVQGN